LFACQDEKGQVETQKNPAEAGEITEYIIYLPPCYGNPPEQRYPVLFLLHGMHNTDQQWVRIGAPAAADVLIQSGKAAPFIIVMPNEKHSKQPIDQSDFGKELINNLVPWIDSHYATCGDRECRAIGGLSRGADWALRIGLSYRQTFLSVGTHSLSPIFHDLDHIQDWINLPSAYPYPRLWLDSGTYDQSLPDARLVEKTLTQNNIPHTWQTFTGAHNEDYWKAHILDYLSWYVKGWDTGVQANMLHR
jgi:enterochelin esterase-like enzyme